MKYYHDNIVYSMAYTMENYQMQAHDIIKLFLCSEL